MCSWSFDVCSKIYSNFTFAFDYQIETRWRWRCWCWCQFWSDAIRYDSRFVFVYLCCQTTSISCFLCFLFLFSFFPFCFPILFCLFSCCCDFLLLLSSLPSLCVFYFHFLRNFIYFAVAAVAILHFALAQLPLSASAPALLDHSFSISLYRPRSPALSRPLLLSCSLPTPSLSLVAACVHFANWVDASICICRAGTWTETETRRPSSRPANVNTCRTLYYP